jgi:hypothetical protein
LQFPSQLSYKDGGGVGPHFQEFLMNNEYMIAATVAHGPNAGCTAIFSADLSGAEVLFGMNREILLREVRRTTDEPFMSDDLCDGLCGAAAMKLVGLLTEADLAEVNLSSIELDRFGDDERDRSNA